MKGTYSGRSFRAWACAAVVAAMPACADAYINFPTVAKEARVVFGASSDPANVVTIIGTTRVDCTYSHVGTNYSGITFNWDDFGTTDTVEYMNLGSLTNFSFGVSDTTSTQVKVEFVDTSDRRASVNLVGLSPSVQTYDIPKSALQASNPLFNFTRTRFINYVLDQSSGTPNGSGQYVGTLSVRIDGGLPFAYNIPPQGSGTLTFLPGQPQAIPVGGASNPVPTVTTLSSSNFTVDYILSSTSLYSGATINFDNYGTPGTNEHQDLSGGSVIIGVSGAPEKIKIEIDDIYTQRVAATLLNMGNTVQYYAIDMSVVASHGVDATQIRAFNFVVDSTLAGPANGTGTFSVFSAGLSYSTNAPLSLTGTATGTPTVLAGKPQVIVIGGDNGHTVVVNTNSSLITASYDVSSGYGGDTILYDNYGTTNIESRDLSGLTNLVVGVYGTPQRVKMQLLDASGRFFDVLLTAVTNSAQYYSLDMSLVTNDAAHIQSINFVVDSSLAGSGNAAGSFSVISGGLDYKIDIDGILSGTISTLPGKPPVITLGGSATNTIVTQASTSDFYVAYSLNPSNFAGGTILFDNFGTATTNEYQDLTSYLPMVFAITGTAASVGLEVEDIFTNRMQATLLSTDSTPPPPPPGQDPDHIVHYYTVQAGDLTNKSVNVARVRFINFVVDQNRAGNPVGLFGVSIGGLKPLPYLVAGAATGTVTLLPPNSATSRPSAIVIGGANSDSTSVLRPSRDTIEFTYNVCTGGYAGATILNDDFGSAPIETADYSGFTSLVYKIRGTASKVNFEFEDATNPQTNRVTGSFTGVTTNWQYFSVSTAVLQQQGLDLAHVRFVNFVVDGNSGGACSGSVDVQIQGLYFQIELGGTGSGTPTLLPNKPNAVPVGSGVITMINTNASQISVFYSLNSSNFAGTIVAFDNFGTTNIESQDLSGFGNIIFGLQGTPAQVKIEFLDAAANKMNIICTNVASTTQYFSVDTSMITNSLTNVVSINFIVDANLAGTNNLAGSFRVTTAGLNFTPQFGPSATGTVSVLPPNNNGQGAFVGAPIGNVETLITRPSRDITHLVYNVCTGGFSAALIVHDDYGTTNSESANYSSMTELVLRVRGTSPKVNLEVKDTTPNIAHGTLTGVTTNWQYYRIPMSELTQQGLNPASVQFITLVIDGSLTGPACSGYVDFNIQGLYYEIAVSPGAGPATVLPNKPTVTQVGTGVTGLVNTNPADIRLSYLVSPTNFAGAIILYDNFGTTNVESQDLTTFTNIVFGLSGSAQSVKIEFLDAAANKMNVICSGIATNTQFYRIDTSLFTNSLASVVSMNFIVDAGLAGPGGLTGAVNIVSGGLDYRMIVAGNATGTPSFLSNVKAVQQVGGGTGTTQFNHLSTSDFSVVYNVAATNYAGGSIIFDDFGTTGTVESADLSSLSFLVFGVTGTANNIEFQIADTSNRVARGTLLSTATASYKYYAVNMSEITNKGVDISKVIYVNFVIDANMLGGASSGAFGVKTAGLPRPPYLVGGSPTGIVSTLPANSTNKSASTTSTGGGNTETVVLSPSQGILEMQYNVCTGGYSGATILHDDFGTTPIETANYSGFTTIVFKVKSTAPTVNFQFEDATGSQTNRVNGSFTGVTTNFQFYSVSAATLSQDGLDLAHVRFINFVIDPNSGGPCSGTVDVQIQGLYFEPTINGSTNGPATIMPNNPAVTNISGAGGSSTVTNLDFSLIQLQYNVTNGFTLATILWDNFGTPAIESQDLTGFTNLVFGLYGKPSSARIEIQDASGRVMRVVCAGVATNLQYYRIDTSLITNDLAHVAAISVVVDSGLTGPTNVIGKLSIVSGGFIHPFYVNGSGSGAESTLPPGPPDVTDVVGTNGSALTTVLATNHFVASYNYGSTFAGAMIRYDNPGTTNVVESGDFSGFGSIVFKVKGDMENTKFEFIDTSGVKVTGFFLGMDTNYQYFAVAASELTGRAFDLGHVKSINLIEDLGSAGNAHVTGTLDVVVGGLNNPTNAPTDVAPRADGDNDTLPDDWERFYGLSSANGSGNNGPNGDPDGDGVPNYEEYIAGSNPNDGSSFSEVAFSRTGTTFYVSMSGFNQRQYLLCRRTNLLSGAWEAVGNTTQLLANGSVRQIDVAPTNVEYFYSYCITMPPASPLSGILEVRTVFGGNGADVPVLSSAHEFIVPYNVTTGYSGCTLNFDNFGTVPFESTDISGYQSITFSVSGTPQRIKYEFLDTNTNNFKVSGLFLSVTNSYKDYTIYTSVLASNGLDLAHVRFINFVVDAGLAGPGNATGTFGVKVYGLTGYTIQPAGQGSGTPTVLPGGPVVSALGGANSGTNWVRNGSTNVVLNYNTLGGSGFDGVTLFKAGGADYSGLNAIVFGVRGNPSNLKIEFRDLWGVTRIATLHGITGTYSYYSILTSDLADAGVDVRHIQEMNFVVDPGLAGAGNEAGTFSVLTGGLTP